MNVSPVSFNQASKLQSFKGTENKKELPGQISPEVAAIKESIDENTAALKTIAKQISLNNQVQYAIEKSKSGNSNLYRDSYKNTSSPSEFVDYVDRHWIRY